MVVPPPIPSSSDNFSTGPIPVHNNMTTITANDNVDAFHHCTSLMGQGLIEQLGWMFYYVKPNSSIFMSVDEVPNYEVQIFPIFGVLVIIEQMIRLMQRKRFSRLSDVIVNIGAGLVFVAVRVALLGVVLKLFYFLYDNYRIVDLPKNCVSTWFISLLSVEFVYYWVHRSLHEINIFWASHQFHHNAVEVDISVTLRDTVVDLVIYEFFPTPLALFVPPPILLVHMQFSLIYQVWLHTEVVSHLGPIEYIINTPRQHRVHHGKNPWCIDKNYGALLMVFDRIFGTYQPEEEKIVFGTTEKPYETFDTVTLHFYYYYDSVWKKFKSMNTFGDKMRALFYGPGWAPGKPRTGLLSDIPPVDIYAPIERYDCEISFWESFYVMLHSFIIAMGFYVITDHPLVRNSPLNAMIIMFYVLFALTSFGTIFDRRSIGPLVESTRCLLFFPFDSYVMQPWIEQLSPPLHLHVFIDYMLGLIRLIHIISIAVWLFFWFRNVRRNPTALKAELLLVSDNKSTLLKEDKCISAFAYSNNINVINQRRPWAIALYAVTMVMSLTFMFFIFALRFEECNSIFKTSNNIEL
uniref:Alkylglycerol monooxygenase n=1 Tax=Dermatophagoides pteronyssinus TaxID=6956 RepID=A0A6P6XS39_DERPT|nr:alkylglycerol monooxygenase-like [Dermatophagoides pteronyssinus]XP_027194715.1 alkylglycerol monooxygenase-like [Dermatophagoides pteronyssinus]